MEEQTPNQRRPDRPDDRPAGSDPDTELSAPQARQGVKLGHMRWVLRIGLILVILGMIGAWLGVWF